MYSTGSGDARSVAVPNTRDSASSMPPDHPSATVWDRQPFGRDKFDRADRDRYSSTKKDWSLDNRSSSHRSASVLFSNGSLQGPPSKRGALGRHGPIVENGRYGSAVGRSSESSSTLRSPSENGKAERDVCSLSGGPSPGYSGSPSTDRLNKDLDGHHFRDSHLSPSDARPASSPRFEPSPRFDSTSRLYGNQNALEGLAPRERERSKFSSSPYAWDTPHRDRDFRERAWSRPEYYKRTCSLPKLDSPRDWSLGDRELLEGRIDRYGSASSREPSFPDVLSANNKEHPRHDWRSRDRSLYSGLSSRTPTCPPTTISYLRDIGTPSARSEVSGVVSPPQLSPLQSSVSNESLRDDTGLTSPKKRPRLTWGQGLAKYEKEKTEEDPSTIKKPEEGSHQELNGGVCGDGLDASDYLNHSLQNGNVIPCQDNCRPCEEQLCISGGVQSDTQVVPYPPYEDSMACSSLEESTREVSADKYIDDFRKQGNSPESQQPLPEHVVPVTSALRPSILHDVQAFLESYQRESPKVSKDVLTQHVEKVELEIDLVEKEILKIDNEHGAHRLLPKKDEIDTTPDQVFCALASSVWNSPVMASRFEPLDSSVSAVQPQVPMQCMGSSALIDDPSEDLTVGKSVEGVLIPHDVTVHLLEPLELEATAKDQVMCGIGEQGGGDSMEHSVLFAAQPVDGGYLEAKGGYECVKFDQGIASAEESGDLIASLLLSNHVTAQQSLSTVAHLNAPGMETILQAGSLYGSPQESNIWKLNAESHERKLRHLESKVAEEKGNTKFAEGILAVKYRAQRESWKQEHIGNYEGKERDKAFRLWEPDQRNSSIPSTHRTSSLRMRLITGSTMPDANSEEVQVARKLISQPPIENEREFLRMPSMFLGKKERALHRFVTKNALVEDPLAAEQERKAMNPWSAEEKKIFLDKYSVLGKNFSKIAFFLDHKSVADCVEFYYRNQKTEEFEKVRRRHQLKKRRDSRSSALYLATTTSVSSRYREANAVYAEGLTLVAAAADVAALVPRDFSRVFRSAATNSCPISSTSCKGFRERHLNKQASNSSAVAGKVGNEEQAGVKGARNMYSRSFKASHEEGDLQWTDSERELFMNAVTMFGKDFHSISLHIGTKNQGQCKSFFSKARKRLGLDQLVERHKAVLQGAMVQNENAAQQMKDMKAEPAINMEGDLSKQQHSFERSPPLVDIHPACLASEVQCKTSQGNHDLEDVAAVSALKSLQEAGYTDGVLPGMSVCKPMQNVLDNPVKQEACSYFDSGDSVTGVSVNPQVIDTPLVDDVQLCAIGDSLVCVETLQFKTDATSVKTEPMVVSNLTNGVSNATPLLVPATASAVVVPALPPNALPVVPVVQSTQVKDQSLKAMETKARREPTSWTLEEKEKFVDVLKVHGRNWDRLRESLPAKSLTQIKTYFQNSKAKLGLGPEGTVNGNGRVSSSRKRKADDSDSSSNAGSGGQTAPQKAPLHSDDGSLKVSPSMLVPPGGLGSNVLAAEALAYANLFSRNSLEDSMNAQKVFQTMGLTANSSTPGILPLFNSAIFAPPNMRPAQQSYVHPASMKTQQIANHQQPQQSLSPLVVVQPLQQPITSVGIHQAQQQQPLARTHQDLSIPVVQHLHKQPVQQQSQANQQALLQQQQQQQQQVVQQLQHQVAEAVLQQQLQPQHIQRQQQQQQQQLQLAAQQVPHHHLQQVLSHHQGQVNQQVSSQAANQLSQGSSQALGSQLATVSQSVAAGQQQQQQSGLFQSQLYQIHSKSQALLQKHHQTPQLQQLQLLQLQWQQQQQQQQQSQVQQGQNQTPHLQQQSFALLNEQQQPLAILRGVMQASSSSAEASKQCDSDFQTLAKAQQGGFEDLHHPLVVSQATQAPNKSQAIPEVQLRAGDVKLFGQSLLSQPASNNMQPSGKVSSASSPQGPFSAASTSFIVGKTSTDALAQAPGDSLIQGPGWQQIVWPTAPFMNSGSSSTVASILQGSVATGVIGSGELEHHSVQEAVACMNERLIREARDMDEGRACDTSYSHMARVPDGRAFSSVLSSLDHGVLSDPASLLSGQCGEIKRTENDSRRSDQLVNIDHVIAVNKSRGQELNQLSAAITGGQVVASQGLPRVLDALVALAEWRLQNSSGGSGRLTDEFLSQSWEALQRDPGSLVEAGKASGSLAQMYAGGSEMLQHLRDSLLYSQSHLMHLHPGAGGGVWAGSSGPVHLSDAQHAVAQSSSSFRVHNGVHHPARSDEAGMVEARDIDGSGGAIG